MHLDRPIGASKENRQILYFSIKCILIYSTLYSKSQVLLVADIFLISCLAHEMIIDPEKDALKRCIWPYRCNPVLWLTKYLCNCAY